MSALEQRLAFLLVPKLCFGISFKNSIIESEYRLPELHCFITITRWILNGVFVSETHSKATGTATANPV